MSRSRSSFVRAACAVAILVPALTACGTSGSVILTQKEKDRITSVEEALASAVSGLPGDPANARYDERHTRKPVRTVRPLQDG